MLGELGALVAKDREAVALAEAAHREARARSLQLEKLQERHDARVRADDLKSEQKVLDEHATRAATRPGGDA